MPAEGGSNICLNWDFQDLGIALIKNHQNQGYVHSDNEKNLLREKRKVC
jgi:hypothetical protein